MDKDTRTDNVKTRRTLRFTSQSTYGQRCNVSIQSTHPTSKYIDFCVESRFFRVLKIQKSKISIKNILTVFAMN